MSYSTVELLRLRTEARAALGGLEAEAAPHLDFYYGVVLERREGRWMTRIVANCGHHHRSRGSAEQCGEKILRSLAK